MPTYRFALALVLLLAASSAGAQSLPETNNAMFAPLALPTPSQTRAADGRPGPEYWQQRNDYKISARLDPATHRISGEVTVQYTNNSPLPLDFVWMHLEQNLFAPGSRGARRTPPDSRWRGSFPEGGYTLGETKVNGRTVAPVIDDTRMRVDLATPIAAKGGTVEISVEFSFVLPEYGADRNGRLKTDRGVVYEVAQWYPKMVVYDDVNGWNALPYLGQGEFYLDYGDFDVELTVPASMTVVATGNLLNPQEVYTSAQQERLARARRSNTAVKIIEPGEVGTARAHVRSSGDVTWKYRAENVRDFAWAASSAFMLDAVNAPVTLADGSTNNVLAMAAYPHEGLGGGANPGWEEAAKYGRESIMNNSRWYPYPYPVAISVAGTVGGMEYPMIQFSGVRARHTGLFGVVDHELGHNWFPMIVGSDERRHAWMDEGFNTFINTFSNTRYYDENADTSIPGYGTAATERNSRTTGNAAAEFMAMDYAQDQPIMTYPDQLRSQALGFLAYRKVAKGLLLLRDQIVGPERFDTAFKAYLQRWAFKHPQPADFMRTIENVSGEDLDWFWRGWFMSTETFDQALTALALDGNGNVVASVSNKGGLVLPSIIDFTFADGTVERAVIPAEAYFTTDDAAAAIPLNGRRVVSATLDPDLAMPDQDRSNDARNTGR